MEICVAIVKSETGAYSCEYLAGYLSSFHKMVRTTPRKYFTSKHDHF
jgi:hypothetical protein